VSDAGAQGAAAPSARGGDTASAAAHLAGVAAPDLLAADLDGTLLGRSGDPLAPGIRASLRGIIEAGVTFCICTGRPSVLAGAAAEALGADRGFAIAYGGAETSELAGGRVSARVVVPPPALLAVQNVADTFDCAVHVHDSPAGPLRIVLSGRPGDIDHAIVALQAAAGDRVGVQQPSADVIAVQAAAATKENALAALAEHLGILPAAVAYFGDAADDVPALAWAGLGVAVGDGRGVAAAAADVAVLPSAVPEILTCLALARRRRGSA